MTDDPGEETANSQWTVVFPHDYQSGVEMNWPDRSRIFFRDESGTIWLSHDQGASFEEVKPVLNDMEKAELEKKIRGWNNWLGILFLAFVGVVGYLSWLLIQDTISVIKFAVLAVVWTIIIWTLMFGVQGVRKGYEKELKDGTSGDTDLHPSS
jgi:hypothetical protein